MIYDNVKHIADERGISIKQLEKTLCIGNGTIGAWKQGAKPLVETVQKIANYFGYSVDELLKE